MAKKEKIILSELKTWLEDSVIDQGLYETLASRYKIKSWDLSTIIRWASAIGALMLGIGLISFFFVILHP